MIREIRHIPSLSKLALALALALGSLALLLLSSCDLNPTADADAHDHSEHTQTEAEAKAKAVANPNTDPHNHDAHDHAQDHDAHAQPEAETETDHSAEEPSSKLDSRDHADFGIQIATAKSGTVHEHLRLPGEVRMNENTMVHVSPRYPGIVQKIHKRLGDRVQANQLLAEMESNDTLQPFDLTAPHNGIITDFHITPGETFEAGERMFIIADTSTVWIDLRVYQRDFPKVHTGQRVTLNFGKDYPSVEATLSYLGPTIDESTRTGLVRAVVPNSQQLLRPGLFVIGQLHLDPKTFPVVIPRSSLIEMEDHTVVYAATPEGFEARTVTTGAFDPHSVAILSGLSAGERYVMEGGFFLKADSQKENFGDGHAH